LASAVEQIKELITKFTSATSKQLIGLDIGVSSVKVSVMSGGGKKFQIDAFATIDLAEAVIIEDEIQKKEDVIAAIVEAVDKLKTKTRSCCLGVSGANTMTKRLQVPEGTKEEMEDHITWESEQYIPFGVDDSEVANQILGKNEGGGAEALLVAARTDMIESFMEVAKEAKLTVKIVDLKCLALNNIFEALYAEEMEEYNETGAIVIDFGAQTTQVVVLKNGGPLLTKEINLGSGLITEEIQRQMGVSYEEAEDLKINGDDSGNIPEEIVPIIDNHNKNLVEEIKKIVAYYVQPGTERIEKVFITGGATPSLGLQELLGQELNVEVIVMNPLEKFAIAKSIDEEAQQKLNSAGLVSLGLALRGCDI
jgi:type IV pilus assembly protein PilM